MNQKIDGLIVPVSRVISGAGIGHCRRWAALSAVVVAAMLLVISSPAAVWSWSGGGGANAYWNNSANWGFAGIPANGDTVIFPASQPNLLNTNNLVGLTLNQVRFVGAGGGYDLRGNAFTLTNGIVATNTAGANTIENSITLATATALIIVSNGISLTLDGNLAGSVGVTKAGLGTLLYQCVGDNTYAGTTLITGGTLQLNVSGPEAFGGPLVIGDGSGAGSPTVQNLRSEEIIESVPITINLNGTLNLATWTETIGTSLTLSGGVISGTGTLSLSANSTITLNNGYSDYIYCNLINGSGTLTLQGNGYLYVEGNVSGSAAIVQTNVSTIWYGANTFVGNYTANGVGFLDLVGSQVLGNPTNTLTLNGQTYILIYGQVNLTNQALILNSTNSSYQLYVYGASINSTWQANVTNNSGFSVDVTAANALNLIGPISGAGGLTNLDTGTLTLSGPTANTFAGATTVSGGTLQLGKAYATVAVPGPLVIGSGSTVRLLNGFQINNGADPLTMSDSSLLNLNGFGEWVGPVTLQGAQITGGDFYFSGNITVNPSTVASSVISGTATIWNNVVTITNTGHNLAPDLLISANINNGGSTNGLIKAGNGSVSLAGNNTFTGPVTISGGNLWVPTSAALGNTNTPLTINSGGCLYVNGGTLDFGLKPLVLNGAGSFNEPGAINSISGSSSWEGSVTLASDTTLYQNAGTLLTLSGSVSGPASLIKSGPGTNTLAGAGSNPYAGTTYVTDGTLNLSKVGYSIGDGTLTIGDGTGNAGSAVVREFSNLQIDDVSVIINSDGLLDLNGHSDSIGTTVTLNGGANIQNTSAGTLTLLNGSTLAALAGSSTVSGNLNVGATNTTCILTNPSGSALTMNASVSGSATILITGGGNTFFNASNSYAGPTLVQQGWLFAGNNFALGSTASGTMVSSGASLVLQNSIGITNEALTLNGPGEPTWGALDVESGTNSWAGPITLNANSTLDAYVSGAALRINGPITGVGGPEFFGAGVHYYDGGNANTYAGTTTVDAGTTLLLNKSGFDVAVPTNLVVNGTVRLLIVNQIANTSDVTVNAGGLLDIAAAYEGIDTLSGAGNVSLSGGYLVLGYGNGSSTFGGLISGANALDKQGTGTITLTGANTYSGNTIIYTGALLVNGSQPQSPVTVYSGATLGGSGMVGTIAASGIVSPGTGSGPGILTSSNVTFSSSGNFAVQLTGPAPGSGYDQLNINGTNILANATLTVVPAFTTPVAPGQQFVIINNNETSANSGTFNGLAEGATISVGGYSFLISYVGGNGNDVVLTLVSVPGGVAGATVTAGDGSHGIDPNGCNNLGLAVTNMVGIAMTGVSATLSTTTEGVLITQPYATYVNIPVNGSGTNLTPFQISTLPSFTCGTSINLQLSVNSSLGAFTINYVLNTGEAAAPTRFDNNIATNVPDVGTIESTNLVASWSGGLLTKVTVSLWLGAPIDSDLSLALIAPDGTTVPLSTGNGVGANFGTGGADASRTTFDDSAATAITAGSPPFVGSFRPQSPLSALIGKPATGAWGLRIQDSGFYGAPDTLRAWSLFLSGTGCATGSGSCDYCLTSIAGTINTNGLAMTNRISRNLVVTSCGSPKVWPGFVNGAYHYNLYSFTNTTASEACVSVLLTSASDVQAGVYLYAFDPANITNNYAADSGSSTSGGAQSCSASIPPGATLFVTVNEISTGGGGSYTLQLSGLPCPPPTLNIQSVAPNKTRVYWDTSAGGYLLEGDSNLMLNAWGTITNEPIVNGGNYNITNTSVLPNNRFYRLHKP
jgi:autotransporter-associated beta strand protein